jgi:GNAT superfamily N-acetyltransferase
MDEQELKFRTATREDVSFIVELLANDELGKLREDFKNPLPKKYYEAFQNISNDRNQELIIVEDKLMQPVATFQISFIQYLTYQGGIRAQIEAVRVKEDHRNKGVGKIIFEWAINRAREKGAHIVQLTTDKKRPDALRFYEQLGFIASHEGMKLHLK